MADLVEIGKNVALLRKAQGMSREWAALHANISVSRWQDIENGCRNTTVETLRRIAEALDVAPLALGVLLWPDEEISAIIPRFSPPLKPLPETAHIGTRIVLLRKRRAYTQRRLALAANVSPARLRDIEHGCANVTVEILERIADALNISLFALGALTLPEPEILGRVHRARAVVERMLSEHEPYTL